MFFTIKMGLDSGAQAELITVLAREKIAYIQTSNGLCLKGSREEVTKAVGTVANSPAPEPVDTNAELPPDVRAFINA